MPRPLLFALVLLCFSTNAQTGPRTWQDQLSINSCNTVTRLGNEIYASYYNGLVHFNEQELAPQRLNKINGLSDVGIRLLRTNPYNNKMLIVYENSNIDVLDLQGNIMNYPDLRLKTMSARKIVNEITFEKELAYLSCGFGIVVFDTDRMEIRETYYIGPGGSNVDVQQVALSNTHIYAATASGLFRASRQSSLLNYNNWKLNEGGLPDGNYIGVLNVAGKLICCKSLFRNDIMNTTGDTLFILEQQGWSVYPYPSGKGKAVLRLSYQSGAHFAILNSTSFEVVDINTGSPVMLLGDFNGQVDYGTLRDSYFYKDYTGNVAYWMADARFGLRRAYTIWDPQIRVTIDGMNNRQVSNVDIHEGRVAVSPSHVFREGQGTYTREGINIFDEGDWNYVPAPVVNGKQIIDINNVLLDRFDPSIMWATSWDYGVLEFKNNKLVRTYTPENSGIDTNSNGYPRQGALVQDEAGNVWFANSESRKRLGVIKRASRKYQSFDYQEKDGGDFTRRMFIDRNNTFWLLHERGGGITVFKHNNFGTYSYRTLTAQQGEGDLGSGEVYSIAEDQDGRIWIGTGAGIRVFYNPPSIFESGNIDAQPIKIVQDGNVELLLGAETVTDIHVDGANNKWVGTSSGGVYCFSPDGMLEIYHFTTDNSPLYSNSIFDLNYNQNTGDLYIASEHGLQTFRSTVIAGYEDYSEFHAFPNPVRPGYTGTVLLRGLLDGSVVKITDVSGNLVWETKSTGGQAEWPVTTLSGNRVTAGVYLVYASTSTAELKTLTKVLVMN